MVTATKDTRQTILNAAFELFRKQGYAATTMHQVAEASTISKGNLTYHFPSKRDLYAAVNSQASKVLQERLMARSFAEAPDTGTGIATFLRRVRKWMLDEEGHFVGCLFTNIAVEAQHSDRETATLARETLIDLKDLVAAYLLAGQARADVRRDREAAELARGFFWMYEGAVTLSRVNNDSAEFDAFCVAGPQWLVSP
jgi:TetR/AcrR family transcriptional repressor of nem operon